MVKEGFIVAVHCPTSHAPHATECCPMRLNDACGWHWVISSSMKLCGTVLSLDVRVSRCLFRLQISWSSPGLTSPGFCVSAVELRTLGVEVDVCSSDSHSRRSTRLTLIHQWYKERLLKSQPSIRFAVSFVCSLFALIASFSSS